MLLLFCVLACMHESRAKIDSTKNTPNWPLRIIQFVPQYPLKIQSKYSHSVSSDSHLYANLVASFRTFYCVRSRHRLNAGPHLSCSHHESREVCSSHPPEVNTNPIQAITLTIYTAKCSPGKCCMVSPEEAYSKAGSMGELEAPHACLPATTCWPNQSQ